METIDRIRNVESIARFANQIYGELDPYKQQALQKRLLEEEHRYGLRSWKLEIVERNIAESAARIDKQRRLISSLKTGGHDLTGADKLLQNLLDIHELFKKFHNSLVNALERNDLHSGSSSRRPYDEVGMSRDEREDRFEREPESAAERRFRLAVEFAPNAMVMVDRAGVIVMLNAQAERVFGYSRAELLGQSIEILVPERFRAAHPMMRAAFFADPQARPMGAGRDLYGLKKDGSEFPVEIGLNPIETEDGMMVLASIIDITERKAAELALRESEHRLRSLAAIIESSNDAIVSVTLDGVITSWNAAAERIFGYTAAEMIGQSALRLAVPGHEAEMLEMLQRIERRERIAHHETRRRHKDGRVLDISLTESPIYDANGQLVGVSKVSRDITASKRTERALKESEARLQELHTELLHVSRLSAMGQMAAVLAHELNQPLTAINNYMEAVGVLLDRGGSIPAARLRMMVERAAEQAVRAGQVIQRLRGFASRGDIEKRNEPLLPLLQEAQELAVLGTRRAGVRIKIGDEIPDVAVLVDKIQIQQVLLNLLRNAAEAVADQDNRDVVMDADLRDDLVEISVTDNGPGLPAEVQDRLFQPFVSTKKTGMGIGLSICHSIVVAHNGRLWTEPNHGGGTIFRLTLHVASAEKTADV